MYRSQSEIEKKMRQVKYLHKRISAYKGRVVVNLGVDPDTGADPLTAYFSSFLSNARSVIQYASKEAQGRKLRKEFDNYIRSVGIFKFFKLLRDFDIHSYSIEPSVKMLISTKGIPLQVNGNTITTEWVSFYVSSLSDLGKPVEHSRNVSIMYQIKRTAKVAESQDSEVDKDEGGVSSGVGNAETDLQLIQGFEGVTDLHRLCDRYVEELESFVQYGLKVGFIT